MAVSGRRTLKRLLVQLLLMPSHMRKMGPKVCSVTKEEASFLLTVRVFTALETKTNGGIWYREVDMA